MQKTRKNAGLDLVLSRVANSIELDERLSRVFGVDLANRLLALAYYCASEGRSPLYRASVWSEDQKLPGNVRFTEAGISKLLRETKVDSELFDRVAKNQCL